MGKNFREILKNKINNNIFNIEAVIKPEATYDQVIENIDKLTKHMTDKGFVLQRYQVSIC